MPTISIIVPVYNVEKYLERCIESILNQTFSEYELILVDDGSTDSSGSLCDSYAIQHQNIYVFHHNNQGQGHARNFALDWVFEKSNTEWICFVDSDDWLHPRFLETMYNEVTKNNGELIICGQKRTNTFSEDDFNLKINPVQILNSEEFYCNNRVIETVPWGKLYSREILKNIRFPEGIIHEDNYFTYRLIFCKRTVLFVNSPLYFYYENNNGTMGSVWSPKRLAVFQGYNQQITFFENHGLNKAKEKVVVTYANVMASQISKCEKLGEYKKYLKRMRKMLRIHLRKYRKESIISFNDYTWAYEKAYPKIMNCYWMVCALRRKVRNDGVK